MASSNEICLEAEGVSTFSVGVLVRGHDIHIYYNTTHAASRITRSSTSIMKTYTVLEGFVSTLALARTVSSR